MLELYSVLAVGIACAALSAFVVLRRWAFIGEGIGHGGLGGAGTAWMLGMAFPFFEQIPVVYATLAIFCIAIAAGIGYFTRTGRLTNDTVIGIFMVAAAAWGFLAQQLYVNANNGQMPPEFDALLFGQMSDVSLAFVLLAAGIGAVVVLCVVLLNKEIVAYSFDPVLAEVSGVRTGAIHYLLIVLMTLTVLIGTRVLGSLLVTALLILPGATALILSRRLHIVYVLSVVISLVGAIGGLLAHRVYQPMPVGPSIALILFFEFIAAWLVMRLKRVPQPA